MLDIYNEQINKVFFISDIHWGVKSASIEWSDNMVDYFQKMFLPLIRSSVLEGYNPCVVVAGDFFDNREVLHLRILDTALGVMKDIASVCPVYVVIGNHDIFKKESTDITSLEIFEGIDNVTVVSDTARLTIAGGKRLLLVSWVGDHVSETKILSDKSNDADIIVLHTEISGMKMDSVRPIINGVNCSAITDKRIYSGHIHTRQDNKNVTYLGSPYDMTRTDIGNQKGIYSVTVTDSGVVEEFTPNTVSPRFVKFTYEELKDVKDLKPLLFNNYVDIYVKDVDAKATGIKKFYDAVAACDPKHVEYFTIVTNVVAVDTNVAVSVDSDIAAVSNEAIASQDFSDDDKRAMIKLNEYYVALAKREMEG